MGNPELLEPWPTDSCRTPRLSTWHGDASLKPERTYSLGRSRNQHYFLNGAFYQYMLFFDIENPFFSIIYLIIKLSVFSCSIIYTFYFTWSTSCGTFWSFVLPFLNRRKPTVPSNFGAFRSDLLSSPAVSFSLNFSTPFLVTLHFSLL